MVNITENFCDRMFAQSTNLFQINMQNKYSAGKWYMDGWIKLPKKERKYYLLMKCSVSTQKNLVRDVHAADASYHLDYWLGVTKIQTGWSGAIVTTISSIILVLQQTV